MLVNVPNFFFWPGQQQTLYLGCLFPNSRDNELKLLDHSIVTKFWKHSDEPRHIKLAKHDCKEGFTKDVERLESKRRCKKNGLANGKECRQMLKISKLAHVILFIGEKQACYAGRAKAEAEPQKYLSIIGDQWMSVLFHISPKNCSRRFFSQYQRHWRYHPHFLTVTSFWHLGHFCSKGFFGQSRLSLMMGRIPQAFWSTMEHSWRFIRTENRSVFLFQRLSKSIEG